MVVAAAIVVVVAAAIVVVAAVVVVVVVVVVTIIRQSIINHQHNHIQYLSVRRQPDTGLVQGNRRTRLKMRRGG